MHEKINTSGSNNISEEERSHSLIPPSARRVPQHTLPPIQEQIRQATIKNIAFYVGAPPDRINARLDELDREWDTERTLELNAALLALSGVLLGKFVNRKWLYLSMGVTGFLAQHALQGWCPPLPVLRRLKVRTRKEIEQERNALKILRDDHEKLTESSDPLHLAKKLLMAVQ